MKWSLVSQSCRMRRLWVRYSLEGLGKGMAGGGRELSVRW